jgi:hypothetical protein
MQITCYNILINLFCNYLQTNKHEQFRRGGGALWACARPPPTFLQSALFQDITQRRRKQRKDALQLYIVLYALE